jgi:uncharacterized cupredoxin-like copper-binding protein
VVPAQQLGAPILPGRPPSTVPDSPTVPPRSLPPGITSTPALATTQVPHPPTPVVRIQVIAPATIAPGKPAVYKIITSNPSQASAHRVQVRMPIPEGVLAISKCEPPADALTGQKLPLAPGTLKELTWNFKTLASAASRTIEIEFTLTPASKEINARAYVAFEHGEQVVTTIEKPRLEVKAAPVQSVAQNEVVQVQVEVRNTSKVSIAKARLVETIGNGLEFLADQQSEAGANTNQRIWQLGTLAPGQAKLVTYRLKAKQGGETNILSNASSEDASVASETVEAKVKILVPGLQLGFTGPTEPVAAQQPAVYEATVLNAGTLPLSDVLVTIPIPVDTDLTSLTNRGKREDNTVTWRIPRLLPGEQEAFRIKVLAKSSGKRSLRALARDGQRLTEVAKELTTVFQGRANLHWRVEIEPTNPTVGKTGTVTVRVENQGTETAKAVRVRMNVPSQITVRETQPEKAQSTAESLLFSPISIAPGKSATFVVKFLPTQAGSAQFRLELEEPDTLGTKNLLKEQTIEILAARQ